MAKIDLRYATPYFQDGLSGTGLVNEGAGATAGATDFDVDTIALNTAVATKVPIGARFTVTGSTETYTVTAVTETVADITDNVVFSPALDANIADDAAITWTSQRIEVKIGAGNLTWTEAANNEYELERGVIDTVTEGDEAPLAVNFQFRWDFVKTGTNETITPYDAITGTGGASGWVSASSDECEKYGVNLVLEYTPNCTTGNIQSERITFPTLRHDSLAFDPQASSITVAGRCPVVAPTIERYTP